MKPCNYCGQPVPPYNLRCYSYRCGRCANIQSRAAKRQYRRSTKGRATEARFRASTKGRIVQARYDATPKRRAKKMRDDLRRLRIAGISLGYVKTPEQAQAIRSYIRRRMNEFKSSRRRSEMAPDGRIDSQSSHERPYREFNTGG